MKMHLNLGAANVTSSVRFYTTLLDAEPLKHYDDYALFVTERPGLELALDLDPAAQAGASEHYGIVVDDSGAVEDAIARLRAAGLALDVETEETCCYAKQNKVWATDPDGRRWEVYTVLEETAEREATCCS